METNNAAPDGVRSRRIRENARILEDALRSFDNAREEFQLSREEVSEELGEQAERLRDLLCRVKTTMNGSGTHRVDDTKIRRRKRRAQT